MDASPLQIEHFISYICSPHIIQDLPFGERSITLSNKEIIKAGGVRATTAMHAGICFGLASFAHGVQNIAAFVIFAMDILVLTCCRS